jgi:prevent-host-death family protein
VATLVRKKRAAVEPALAGRKQMAAGEFKAKCLRLIDEVNETGEEIVITKRGKPKAKLIPFRLPKKDSFFGRLKGIITIHGDLVEPTVPLEDWDMLK